MRLRMAVRVSGETAGAAGVGGDWVRAGAAARARRMRAGRSWRGVRRMGVTASVIPKCAAQSRCEGGCGWRVLAGADSVTAMFVRTAVCLV